MRVRMMTLLALASLLGASCGSGGDDAVRSTGTETNFLVICGGDDECGSFTCECGVCTEVCDTDADCSVEGAVCGAASSAAFEALCSDEQLPGVCVMGCSASCDDGYSCVNGDCVADDGGDDDGGDDDGGGEDAGPRPSTDAPTTNTDGEAPTSDAGLLPAVTDPVQPDAPDGEADTDSSVPEPDGEAEAVTDSSPTDAGLPDEAEPAPQGPQPDDAGATPVPAPEPVMEEDAGALADECSGLEAEVDGCCYSDDDCGIEEQCLSATCDQGVAGRCRPVLPPEGSCFGDRDCPDGEICDGASIPACLSAAPEVLGSCVAAPVCETFGEDATPITIAEGDGVPISDSYCRCEGGFLDCSDCYYLNDVVVNGDTTEIGDLQCTCDTGRFVCE